MSRKKRKNEANGLSSIIAIIIAIFTVIIVFVIGAFVIFMSKTKTETGKVEDINAEQETIVSTDETADTNTSNEQKEDAASDNTGDKKADATSGKSIQDELAEVEAKAKEHSDNWDSSNARQQEMNIFAGECFKIWDDELNSLWNRLTEEVDASTKDKLVKEQKAWISEKEKNSTVAGFYAKGGSMQPMLETTEAEAITHARVYTVAGYLADARGESFSVPADVQKVFDNMKTLDDVFTDLQGEWMFDESRGAVIGVQKSAECDYGVPDTKWTVWITGGDLLSDLDVYGYCGSTDTIVFEKSGGYYELKKAFDDENTVVLSFTNTLEEICEDPIYADRVK